MWPNAHPMRRWSHGQAAGPDLRDRGELVLYKLDRPTEMTCARCAGRSTTRWIAVLADGWTRLWCKACFLACLPADLHRIDDASSTSLTANSNRQAS
jgi:hypothetical protein